jgi:hypothetical protein
LRKLFAILMLAVCLFNLAGYSFLFNYYIYQSGQSLSAKVDANQYTEANLTEIKIKLNLPYLADWAAYERFDGEIEVKGIHYNYVKRKVSQDTLYLLCLPNELKTELYKVKNDYAVKANDLPTEKQNKVPMVKKAMFSEVAQIWPIQFVFSNFEKELQINQISSGQNIADTFIPSAGEPPEYTIS